ncbi:hypothetical protein [Candidatus Tisiphia endosymbiont of Sialis lutaria]|uniref:hypothetical protein n=1 Tax=Candidatus Tisiphia endosymbiont of Sialis lutaria TaxID=2029164 RepID=UPI00312C7932
MSLRISILFNIGLTQLVLISTCKAEGGISPHAKFDKSNSSSEILASSNIINTNASFTDKEIDLENIFSKENTPPFTSFGISNRNQSRYFAFGADENRSPSLLTQESKESTPKLPTIARRKVYRVRLSSQKGNQSLEEKKQMEIIVQNPNTMVSESSKEDVLGTVTATSSTEVKQWDATSPLPSHQSSGTNLGGSPTTNLAKYVTSTPTEIPENLVLSPSNNSQSDKFRDYRDSSDPILKSPTKNIILTPLFNNNDLSNTDLLSTYNQLQKIQPKEDEEQGLVSEFKNLSITYSPDLEASSSGTTQLTLPTTAMMPNTTNHLNKKQRRKEKRQQARAEQNRAIEYQPIAPKTVTQQPLTPIVNSGELGSMSDGATPIYNKQVTSDDATNFSSIDYTTNKIPDATFIQDKIEQSIRSDEGSLELDKKSVRSDKGSLVLSDGESIVWWSPLSRQKFSRVYNIVCVSCKRNH